MAVLLATLVLVLATAISSPMKDDVAWLLYVARKWLGGERLYQDIVEVNPPLIIWIYALPAMLSSWFGISPKTISEPMFAALLLGCAWWTADLLRGRDPLFARRLPAFGAIGTVLLLLPGVEFGQREHLLVAAALPYLALFVRETQGEAEPRRTAVLAGVLAALGCALKPSYAMAFGLLELIGWMRGTRITRLAVLSAAATLGLYGLGVLLFCPAFLDNAVPLALALYGGTDTPCRQILAESHSLLGGVAVTVVLALQARYTMRQQPFLRALLIALATFALAATISYILQGKNWFYHRLPAATVTVLALLLWTGAMLRQRPRPSLHIAIPAVLVLAVLAEFGWSDYWRMQSWVVAAVEPNLSTEVKLERLVRREHAHTYIAFSEWIALGFPVVNNTGVAWASRFNSMSTTSSPSRSQLHSSHAIDDAPGNLPGCLGFSQRWWSAPAEDSRRLLNNCCHHTLYACLEHSRSSSRNESLDEEGAPEPAAEPVWGCPEHGLHGKSKRTYVRVDS